MARLWEGKDCHYCSSAAQSHDHIIPRAWLRRAGLTDLPVLNVVPSCLSCNITKGHKGPVCRCGTCVGAVESFLEMAGLKAVTALGLRRGLTYALGDRIEDKFALMEKLGLDSGSADSAEFDASQEATA